MLGVGGGAVVAVLALGLVVTYQSSGVVNFAHAALGTYSAFAFTNFRSTGRLVWPVFGVPDLDLGGRPTVITAMLAVIVLAGVIGLVLAVLVYRPLRLGSPLARMVASLGVMLYLIEVCATRFGPRGATSLVIRSVLPDGLVRLGDRIAIYQDRLWLAGVAVVSAVVLAAIGRFTRFGLATRAVAENERAAVMLGVRAEVVAAFNWVLASMLAAMAMILAAPITKLQPVETSMLVVPAIAAALVARFSSPLLAVGAALAIGMIQSEILYLQTIWAWLPDVGLQQGVPLVVILAVLALRAGALPARGTLGQIRLPSVAIPRGAGAFVVVAGALAGVVMWFGSSQWRTALIITAIGSLSALSVVITTGYVGQISLATSAFAGVSAFVLVKLSTEWGLGFPWAPLLATVVATLLGTAIGLPALRVRGLTLAMATLAAALAVENLVFPWSWLTGGVAGTTVPAPRLPGLDLDIQAIGDSYPRRAFGLMVIVVATLILWFAVQFGRSATARRWLAVRSNERAAAAIGVAVSRVKLQSFAMSAFIAGIAGALVAYQQRTLSVGSFGAFGSIVLVAIVYLAGIGTPLGALLAGIMASGGVLTVAMGQDASRYQFAVNGVMLVVAAVLLPDGIVGRLTRHRTRSSRRSLAAT